MRKPLPLSSETADLLRHERQLEPASPEQRRRVLARARLSQRVNTAAPRRSSVKSFIVAACLGLGFAAAAAALSYRALHRDGAALAHPPSEEQSSHEPLPPREPEVLASLPTAPKAVTGDGGIVPHVGVASSGERSASDRPLPPTKADLSGAAADQELVLLARIRTAVGKGHHTAALAAIDEHTRRFPKGRLREEREALRVTALWNSGQHESARRAAARFAKAFPRSVLSAQMAAKAKAQP